MANIYIVLLLFLRLSEKIPISSLYQNMLCNLINSLYIQFYFVVLVFLSNIDIQCMYSISSLSKVLVLWVCFILVTE